MTSEEQKYGAEEPQEWLLFNADHRHERDEQIHFYPDPHVYTFQGQELKPVSTLIAEWFPEFDSEAMAEMKATEACPKEKLLEQWAVRRERAAQAGTFMHRQIELSLLQQPIGEEFPFIFNGDFHHIDETISVSRELQMFRHFFEQAHPIPYRTEWRICDEEYGVAGTIDFLTRAESGEFVMFDWKRSLKIGYEDNYSSSTFHVTLRDDRCGRTAYAPMAHIPDTSVWHYALQQNLYRYMLHKHYGIQVDKLYLVVLHPEYSDYHLVSLPLLEKEIETMLTCKPVR